jgi:hypothetical protein
MSARIHQFCWQSPDQHDAHFAKLAEFQGIDVEQIPFTHDSEVIGFLQRLSPGDDSKCVAIASRAIAQLIQSEEGQRFIEILSERVPFLFVYGFSPLKSHDEVLGYLTRGLLTAVGSIKNIQGSYRISKQARDFCKQFAGLEFGPIDSESDCFFTRIRKDGPLETHISIGENPFLVELKRGKTRAFLVANCTIANIDQPVDPGVSIKSWFSRLVPAMMFMRCVFQDRCWHNDRYYASLIIDDPLLRERYGFLKYRDLLIEMDRNDFSSAIAFIPWNYRRSDGSIAELFKRRPDRLTLCVHGNDHSNHEFGSSDTESLCWKALHALERMKLHRKLTEVSFDDVMIFPQGVFSSASIQALKTTNYLGAVNSSLYSVDATDSPIKLRDLLDAAVMRYHAFPLLIRRYPRDIAELAFDFFLGRPAFLTAHHDYFRNGFDQLLDFVAQVKGLQTGIHWTGLGEAIRNTYLQRKVGDHNIHARFFSSRVTIRNQFAESIGYLLFKKQSQSETIAGVWVNSLQVPYKTEHGNLVLKVRIEANRASTIEVRYKGSFPVQAERSTSADKIKVFVRRHLSELRDNHLSKNEGFLELAMKVKAIFKL